MLHYKFNETDSDISTVTVKAADHRALKIPAVKMIVFLLKCYAMIRQSASLICNSILYTYKITEILRNEPVFFKILHM